MHMYMCVCVVVHVCMCGVWVWLRVRMIRPSLLHTSTKGLTSVLVSTSGPSVTGGREDINLVSILIDTKLCGRA